jgi:hypothetical protein
MNTGHNPMLPLSDFTVTFVDHKKIEKQKILWEIWWPLAGYPDYDLLRGNKVHFKFMKEPTHHEIIMPIEDPPYELVWAK